MAMLIKGIQYTYDNYPPPRESQISFCYTLRPVVFE